MTDELTAKQTNIGAINMIIDKNNERIISANKHKRIKTGAITMQAMTIRNMKDSEVYFKDFHSMDEARNWVINHLDLSKEWLIILIKPKKQEQ
jgi:hypothetical protein